jgi:hypothetical protein
MRPDKVVLFIAGDPGGASSLLPVIAAWQGPKAVLAYRQALKIFTDAGIECLSLNETPASITAASERLSDSAASALVAATSVNGVDWEQHFFMAARQLNLPSLSLLDYWSNYTPRFTLTKPLDAVPDQIAIMDERARDEMIAEGFSASQLVITGQPVLDEARRWRSSEVGQDREGFRQSLGLKPGETAVLFVSQPLREIRIATSSTDTSDDEYQALDKLIAELKSSPTTLLVKMHPREPQDKYARIMEGLPFPARIVDPSIHRWGACIAADRIYGLSSMLLEEAKVMGCAVDFPGAQTSPPSVHGDSGRSACESVIRLIARLLGVKG